MYRVREILAFKPKILSWQRFQGRVFILSPDRLYAEETPGSIENSFNVEHQESLEAKISPCLDRGQFDMRVAAAIHKAKSNPESDCPYRVKVTVASG